jgi:hypothetical protein
MKSNKISQNFTKFHKISHKISQNFTKFHKILQNFTKFHKILQNFTKFHKMLQNFTKCYKISQNFTKVYDGKQYTYPIFQILLIFIFVILKVNIAVTYYEETFYNIGPNKSQHCSYLLRRNVL